MRIECRKEILNIEPYIPGKHIDEVKREFGLTEIIKLASNENPLGASNKVQSTIAESLPIFINIQTETALNYARSWQLIFSAHRII